MACWHTCVSNPSLGIYGKTLEKVSTHSEMRAADFARDMCVKSKYESADKSRDEKEWNASKGLGLVGGGETNMRNCRHFSLSAVGLHVHFFTPLHYLNKMGAQEEEGAGGVLITVLYYYYCKPAWIRVP